MPAEVVPRLAMEHPDAPMGRDLPVQDIVEGREMRTDVSTHFVGQASSNREVAEAAFLAALLALADFL